MIAEVVPYTRTIRGKDHFDYAIPEGLVVSPGDLVDIVFRSKKIVGLVFGIKQVSEAKHLQPLLGVREYSEWKQPERRAFLQWFAEYYAISLPSAFRTMQFPILKRVRAQRRAPRTTDQQQTVSEMYTETRIQIVRGASHVLRYDQRADCVRFYQEYIAHSLGHALIVVPDIVDAYALENALRILFPTHVLTSDASPSVWHRAIDALRGDIPTVFIGTKRAVFLPWHYFRTVIVDQEESRSHKQFDQNPRYHVRAVVERLAVHGQSDLQKRPTVLYTSIAPSVDRMAHAEHNGDVVLHLAHSLSDQHVQVVDMELERRNKNYSWFSDQLIITLQNSKKSFLFFNRVGMYGAAVCTDCGTLLPYTAVACTQCHGQRIRYTRKGTQQLEKELQQLFPNKRILRVDRDQDAALLQPLSLERADMIVGTEKVLHVLPLSYFDCIGVLSVDHLLVYPHFRSNERVYQLLAEFCSMPMPVIIQTSAPHHPVIRFVVHGAYDAFVKEELQVRKMLSLPPFGERFIVLDVKTKHTQTIDGPIPLQLLTKDSVIDRQ